MHCLSVLGLADAPAGISQAGCWSQHGQVPECADISLKQPSGLQHFKQGPGILTTSSQRATDWMSETRKDILHLTLNRLQQDGHKVITELEFDGPSQTGTLWDTIHPGDLGNAKGSATDGTQRGEPLLHPGADTWSSSRAAQDDGQGLEYPRIQTFLRVLQPSQSGARAARAGGADCERFIKLKRSH